MFARLLRPPRSSCFLFGPRGTGKSTWIGRHYAGARLYDLLNTTDALRLAREPATLFREVEALPAGEWVVIDEVQRVPELLNEVHRLRRCGTRCTTGAPTTGWRWTCCARPAPASWPWR